MAARDSRPGPPAARRACCCRQCPEYVFQIFGAALAGACIVGVNATRRGAELARDIDHTACQFVIADPTYGDLVDDPVRVEDAPWADIRRRRVAGHRSAIVLAAVPAFHVRFDFGAQGRRNAARAGWPGWPPEWASVRRRVLYCPLTLAHGNALNATLFPALAQRVAGWCCAIASRRVRGSTTSDRNEVTFTSTVGRALGYILATPPTAHDRDHRLKVVLAPEASPRDMRRVPRAVRSHGAQRLRFERGRHRAAARGQAGLARDSRPPAPTSPSSTGRAWNVSPPSSIPTARCRNATAAIGELVRRDAAGGVRGLLEQPGCAVRSIARRMVLVGRSGLPRRRRSVLVRRTRGGLAAGRLGELRGQSRRADPRPIRTTPRRSPSSGCPIRWPETRFWRPSSCGRAGRFDPDAFAAFLDAQSDLGTKWAPRFVRVMPAIPVVGQGKIDKKPLRRDAWLCEDPVWWRPARSSGLCTHDRCRP